MPCCFCNPFCLLIFQAIQRGPLHLAATVHLGLQNDPYFTTQNQVEVPRSGSFRRARLPLEATIRISPTLQLTNGLPYDVLGWAIAPPHKELAGSAATAVSAPASRPTAATDSGIDDRMASGAALDASATSEASGTLGSGTAAPVGPAVAAAGRSSFDLSPAPAAAGAASSKLSGLQQVWAAGSKREAELALARLVAGM